MNVVSTHAVLRYIERGMGVDLASIRREMRAAGAQVFDDKALLAFIEVRDGISEDKIREQLTAPIVIAAINAGASRVTLSDCRLVIQDKRIVTVLPMSRPQRGQWKVRKGRPR
jgi:hypothetical protein